MILKPQDLVVALKLVSLHKKDWTYLLLASELAMSASEINAGIKRAIQARLLSPGKDRDNKPQPVRAALLEFLLHGVRYAFAPDRGEMTLGMPTGWAAQPLSDQIVAAEDPPPVWPDPQGEVRGMTFSALYPTVPRAARQDAVLYELLVLVDGIRGGRAREQKIAAKLLSKRLGAKR
jgi:hypothetical protein